MSDHHSNRRPLAALGVAVAWLATVFAAPAARAATTSAHQAIEGTPLVLDAAGLFDTAVLAASVRVLASPDHGGVTLELAGAAARATYVPAAAFRGHDRFTLGAKSAEDGTALAARVELTVLPRLLPFAGRFDAAAEAALGAYDTWTTRATLCAPWPSTDTLHCSRHEVRGAAPGWLPVLGDWDGDGSALPSLFDRATGTLHRLAWSTVPPAPGSNRKLVISQSTTIPGAARRWPLAGDWDGDGQERLALYDAADGSVVVVETGTWGVGPSPRPGSVAPPAGDDLPALVRWPVTTPSGAGVDALGVAERTRADLRWLTLTDGPPRTGAMTYGRPLGDRWPVFGTWPFLGHAAEVLLAAPGPLDDALGPLIEAWSEGHPQLLPIRYPGDPDY